MTTYNKKEIRRILRKNGWHLDHYTGSHAIYKKEGERPLTIGTKSCNKMIFQRLAKEHNLILD